MCDFPIRRESGTGNRIPGDFFACFLGRARKQVPPRHERAKKEQTPVGERHTIKPTVKLGFRVSGRAGRLPSGGPQFVALRAESCDRSRASDHKNNCRVKYYVCKGPRPAGNRVLSARLECPAAPGLLCGRSSGVASAIKLTVPFHASVFTLFVYRVKKTLGLSVKYYITMPPMQRREHEAPNPGKGAYSGNSSRCDSTYSTA